MRWENNLKKDFVKKLKHMEGDISELCALSIEPWAAEKQMSEPAAFLELAPF